MKNSLALNHSQARLAYRPDEAARLLGVSRATLFKLLAQGKLERIKFGSKLVLIPHASIEVLLKGEVTG